MVAKQKVWLARQWARTTVTIHLSETTLAIELSDGDTKVVRRTTDQPVRNITSMRPRTASSPKAMCQVGTDTPTSRTYRVKTPHYKQAVGAPGASTVIHFTRQARGTDPWRTISVQGCPLPC